MLARFSKYIMASFNSIVLNNFQGLVSERKCEVNSHEWDKLFLLIFGKNQEKVATACRRYGIPRSTVKFQLSNKCKQQSRSGPPTVLSNAEEKALAEWIKKMARKGFPVTKYRLINVVISYLEKNPGRNTFKNGKPSTQWVRSFLDRFKELSIRTPESVTNASANVTELDIRRWFKEVYELLEEEGVADILQDPRRVLNGDEACFYLDPSADKVIANRGDRNVYKVDQGPAKKNITVMFTCSADGKMLPPLVILPYKKIPIEVTQSVPAEWGLGKTDSGWMNKDCFLKYIRKILHPQLVEQGVLPVIYFVDGHTSHTSWETAEECQKLGIILVCLYANCTRIIQPLDVAVFKPLKVAWLKTVDDWKCSNPNKYLKSEHFAPLLNSAMGAVDEQIIQHGFEACGLFPWDEARVDYSKCLAQSIPPNPVMEADGTNVQVMTSDSMQRTTFPVILSQAEEIMKMLGKDRVSRYKQAEENFASDDDRILYHVFKMLLPLESRVYVAEEELRKTPEKTEIDPDRSDDEQLPPSSTKESPEENYSDAPDSDNDALMKTDPLADLNDMQFEMVLLDNEVAPSYSVNEEPGAKHSEISSFLEMQTPETPHRKGTRQFKHRSPAVLTSRRRLEYHKLKAEEKAKADTDKKHKAELKAQKKAEIEAGKKAKSELRKNKNEKAVKSKSKNA